jgi:hypothetical protein
VVEGLAVAALARAGAAEPVRAEVCGRPASPRVAEASAVELAGAAELAQVVPDPVVERVEVVAPEPAVGVTAAEVPAVGQEPELVGAAELARVAEVAALE